MAIYHLTKREDEALSLASKGYSDEEIAKAMGITTHTVEHHLGIVYEKLLTESPETGSYNPRARAVRLFTETGKGWANHYEDFVIFDPLTLREQKVAGLIAEGYNNSAIADTLGISVRTVENHINGILGKYGIENKAKTNGGGKETKTNGRIEALLKTLAQKPQENGTAATRDGNAHETEPMEYSPSRSHD